MSYKMKLRMLAGASLLVSSLSMQMVFADESTMPASVGGLPVDKVSSEAIRAATTEERFMNDWVSVIPDHPTIPSPRDFLGHIAGAPGEMTNVAEIHAYMRAIADATDRAEIVSLGQTAEGREMIAIIIADPETLTNLDDYKARLNALADPRGMSDADAEATIDAAKPIYWITAGLHSTEYGPPETALEIAYRVAAEDRELFKDIRSNVITMITPVFEVDGRNRSTEWFLKHNKGRTDYYDRPPSGPPFWGKYTFHDNNRDGIGLTQPMTKNFLRGFNEYKPTLSLDLHESVPYLYVATGTGPYNPGVSATTVTEWASIANYEVNRLTTMGMPGVWTWGFYTGWWPGYMLWVTNNRNSNGRFYETFGNGGSETMLRDLGDSRFAGDKTTDKTWYRPSPPSEETLWSMRNNVNFMSSGVYASLEYASKNAQQLVAGFYSKSKASIAEGASGDVKAILIPNDQRDSGAARELIDLVMEQGIEVSIAGADGEFGDVEIERGDALIKLNQPYGPFAKALFEEQEFPEDVDVPPYDDVAWTLGLMRGVDVEFVEDVDVLELKSSKADSGAAFYEAEDLPGRSRYYAVAHRGQEGLGELRFALASATMHAAKAEVKSGRNIFPAGSIFIDASTVDKDALERVVENTLLDVVGLNSLPKGEMIELDVPRIGLLHSWISTQDPGWVRYTFDQSQVPYSIIEKAELKAGNLLAKYDVIVAPSFGRRGSLKALVNGVDKKWSPLAYETTPETPSHGRIVSSPDVTGGFGFDGMAALQSFISEGGTFIGLASGGSLVAESGITSDVSMNRPRVNTPGSFVRLQINDTTSPLTFGYDEISYAFRGNTPFYSVGKDDRDLMVAQFGSKKASVRPWKRGESDGDKKKSKSGPLILSGGVLSGKKQLNGAPAIIETTVGEGQAILFGWNPLHRHLNHHDHAFVYNALMFWNDLK
ncbi:M14 family zinc carboxypeptidase [Kordiimonas aquimaris]|uniref:M14 family zinc carboxypeptidase n=1 Tax=Kordiimonas aquimaris TaxID=707591 RepID=UPI0021D2EBBE|nr:M14 family zinc carboxypeptidase [Kordiimonas aquimaris]